MFEIENQITKIETFKFYIFDIFVFQPFVLSPSCLSNFCLISTCEGLQMTRFEKHIIKLQQNSSILIIIKQLFFKYLKLSIIFYSLIFNNFFHARIFQIFYLFSPFLQFETMFKLKSTISKFAKNYGKIAVYLKKPK